MDLRLVSMLVPILMMAGCISTADETTAAIPDETVTGDGAAATARESATPPVDKARVQQPALEDSGAFDRGRAETLVLDPGTDLRLQGRVLTRLDIWDHEGAFWEEAIAVAMDGAI